MTPHSVRHRNCRWSDVRTARRQIHLSGRRIDPYLWNPGDEVVALFATAGALPVDQTSAISAHLVTFVTTFGPLLANAVPESRARPHHESLTVLTAHARHITRVITLASGHAQAVRRELQTWAQQWSTPKQRGWVAPAADKLRVTLDAIPQLAALDNVSDADLSGLAHQVIAAALRINLDGTERRWVPEEAKPIFVARTLLAAIYWTLADQLGSGRVYRCEECERLFPSSRKRRFCPHFPKHANSPCAVRAAQRRFRGSQSIKA